VDGTGSASCATLGFDVSAVQPSGYAATVLVRTHKRNKLLNYVKSKEYRRFQCSL
jgi:hypothetical protein